MFVIKNFVSGELRYNTDAMRKICIRESVKAKENQETKMEINGEKKEAYVRASEENIYDWAKGVGLPIEAVVKTAIYAELKKMYDVGFMHCNEAWKDEMKDAAIERDLSE